MNPMPSSGKPAASTALPQPPNTSQNVPRNSANNFLDMIASSQNETSENPKNRYTVQLRGIHASRGQTIEPGTSDAGPDAQVTDISLSACFTRAFAADCDLKQPGSRATPGIAACAPLTSVGPGLASLSDGRPRDCA